MVLNSFQNTLEQKSHLAYSSARPQDAYPRFHQTAEHGKRISRPKIIDAHSRCQVQLEDYRVLISRR